MVFQIQLLLAGLTALAPLLSEESRARAEQLLFSAQRLLAAASAIGAHAEDIAGQYESMRAELEEIAGRGRAISSEQFSSILTRLQEASAAFRAALRDAEAGA